MCGGGGGTVWGNGTTDGVEKGVIHTQNIRRKGGGIVLGGKGQRQVQLTLLKPSYQNNYWLFAGQGLVKIRSVFQKQAHKKTQIIKKNHILKFSFFCHRFIKWHNCFKPRRLPCHCSPDLYNGIWLLTTQIFFNSIQFQNIYGHFTKSAQWKIRSQGIFVC